MRLIVTNDTSLIHFRSGSRGGRDGYNRKRLILNRKSLSGSAMDIIPKPSGIGRHGCYRNFFYLFQLFFRHPDQKIQTVDLPSSVVHFSQKPAPVFLYQPESILSVSGFPDVQDLFQFKVLAVPLFLVVGTVEFLF